MKKWTSYCLTLSMTFEIKFLICINNRFSFIDLALKQDLNSIPSKDWCGTNLHNFVEFWRNVNYQMCKAGEHFGMGLEAKLQQESKCPGQSPQKLPEFHYFINPNPSFSALNILIFCIKLKTPFFLFLPKRLCANSGRCYTNCMPYTASAGTLIHTHLQGFCFTTTQNIH